MARGITKGLPIVIKLKPSKEADDHDQTAKIFLSPRRDVERPGSLDRPLRLIFIGRLGRRVEESHDRGAIEPRSRCDRTTIAARSSCDRGSLIAESIHDHQTVSV